MNQPIIEPKPPTPEAQHPNVRVSKETHRTLHLLSQLTGHSIASIIGMLAEEELTRHQAQKGDK